MSHKRVFLISVAVYVVFSAFLFSFLKYGNLVFAESLMTASNIPSLMVYQGSVKARNGERDIVFRIFDAETSGNEVWTEYHTSANGNPVRVTKKQFAVVLGEVEPLGPDVFSTAERWMEIEVDGQIQFPRFQFTSVAYAFRAGRADLANSVPDGSITQTQAPSLLQGFSAGEHIEYGTSLWSGDWSPNPAAGTWYRIKHITFSTPFSEPPHVFISVTSPDPEAWGISSDITTGGFDAKNVAVVHIPNTYPDTFNWIAIGR